MESTNGPRRLKARSPRRSPRRPRPVSHNTTQGSSPVNTGTLSGNSTVSGFGYPTTAPNPFGSSASPVPFGIPPNTTDVLRSGSTQASGSLSTSGVTSSTISLGNSSVFGSGTTSNASSASYSTEYFFATSDSTQTFTRGLSPQSPQQVVSPQRGTYSPSNFTFGSNSSPQQSTDFSYGATTRSPQQTLSPSNRQAIAQTPPSKSTPQNPQTVVQLQRGTSPSNFTFGSNTSPQPSTDFSYGATTRSPQQTLSPRQGQDAAQSTFLNFTSSISSSSQLNPQSSPNIVSFGSDNSPQRRILCAPRSRAQEATPPQQQEQFISELSPNSVSFENKNLSPQPSTGRLLFDSESSLSPPRDIDSELISPESTTFPSTPPPPYSAQDPCNPQQDPTESTTPQQEASPHNRRLPPQEPSLESREEPVVFAPTNPHGLTAPLQSLGNDDMLSKRNFAVLLRNYHKLDKDLVEIRRERARCANFLSLTEAPNSLFASVSHQLFHTVSFAAHLRKAMVRYMRANRERYVARLRQYLSDEDIEFDTYCTAMELPGTWATEFEVGVLTDLLKERFNTKYEIKIYSLGASRVRLFPNPDHLLHVARVQMEGVFFFDSMQRMVERVDNRPCTFLQDFRTIASALEDLERSDPRFASLVNKIRESMDKPKVEYEALQEPFSVALVGKMGSGKSAVANAIIGAQLLCSASSGKAVTQHVTRITGTNASKFTLCIKYKTAHEWTQDKDNMIESIKNPGDDTSITQYSIKTLLQTSAKIRNEGELHSIIQNADNGSVVITDNHTVQQCIQQGTETYTLDTLAELQAECKRLWKRFDITAPVIEEVTISGPFEHLAGITLVDMPGLGDLSDRRKRLADETRKKCQCYWIVTKFDRCIDEGETHRLIREHQVNAQLSNGRLSDVSIIVTRADDFRRSEEENEFDAHGLNLDDETLLALRKEYLEYSMQHLLRKSLNPESTSTEEQNTLGVFITSATESLIHEGISNDRSNLEATESSPQRSELFGITRLRRAIQSLMQRRDNHMRVLHETLLLQREHLNVSRERIPSISIDNLRSQLQEATQRVRLSSLSSNSSLSDAFLINETQARNAALTTLRNQFYEMHHNTYRAAVRHGGSHYSLAKTARAGPIDMNGEIADSYYPFLNDSVDRFHRGLSNDSYTALRSFEEEVRRITEPFDDVSPFIQRRMQRAVSELTDSLNALRRNQIDIRQIVVNRLRPSFSQAGSLSGPRCTSEMHQTLSRALESLNATIIADILDRLRDIPRTATQSAERILEDTALAIERDIVQHLETSDVVTTLDDHVLIDTLNNTYVELGRIRELERVDSLHDMSLGEITTEEGEECAICTDSKCEVQLACGGGHKLCLQCALRLMHAGHTECPFDRRTFDSYEHLVRQE